MPLTVGDSSTYYHVDRKERSEVGKNKGMTINPCKKSGETFTPLVTNAIGDPF